MTQKLRFARKYFVRYHIQHTETKAFCIYLQSVFLAFPETYKVERRRLSVSGAEDATEGAALQRKQEYRLSKASRNLHR